jgi:NAD(P)-dependent dehydrogenase (short-subunit alcohol dehydrogenase family)
MPQATKNQWTAADLPDLTGQTAIVTGASHGLGLVTARDLTGAGAHVVLAVRDTDKGAAVARTIGGDTTVQQLDLSDLGSVQDFADRWRGDIDVLINNAGIMQVPEGKTADGFERQIGTNHLGHFALTNLLLPSVTGRIVTLSSELHTGAKLDVDDLNWQARTYDSAQAYKDSKLANLLFARELQRRLTGFGSGVRSVAAHPGLVRTGLFGHVGGLQGAIMNLGTRLVAQDAEHGVLPTLFAATQDIPGGSFVGPDGFQHVRGYPEIVSSSKDGEDVELGRRLWDVSARLTNTDAALPAAV